MHNSEKSNLVVSDGFELKLHHWKVDNARCDIMLCHGFQEHAGRYDREGRFFNEKGFSLYSFDQRGHGLSKDKYDCYIQDFDRLIEDYKEVMDHYGIGSERPFVLMGHSMGGLVVVSFYLKHNVNSLFKGMLLSAPLLAPNPDMAPILQKLSLILESIVPRFRPISLDANEISSLKTEVSEYKKDPLIYHGGIYTKSGAQLLRQMRRIEPQFPKVACSLIVQHSKDDKLSEYSGSQKLVELSQSADKTLVSLEGVKHEIMKDSASEKVLGDFASWIDERI